MASLDNEVPSIMERIHALLTVLTSIAASMFFAYYTKHFPYVFIESICTNYYYQCLYKFLFCHASSPIRAFEKGSVAWNGL